MSGYSVKKKYWGNGKLKEESPYLGNKRQGVTKRYNEQGIMEIEIDYSDNKINGHVKTYYENGQIESTETYKDGVRLNDLIVFNRDGNITYSQDREIKTREPICSFEEGFCYRHI